MNYTDDDIAALILDWKTRQDAYMADLATTFGMVAAWANGAAGGGPNNDGRYPLPTGAGTVTLVSSPQQMRVDATALRQVVILNQAAAVLDASHAGALVRVTSPNTTALTISNAVPLNWSCIVLRDGAGAVTFAMGAGGVLKQGEGFDRLRSNGALANLICSSRNANGATVNLTGILTDSAGT